MRVHYVKHRNDTKMHSFFVNPYDVDWSGLLDDIVNIFQIKEITNLQSVRSNNGIIYWVVDG